MKMRKHDYENEITLKKFIAECILAIDEITFLPLRSVINKVKTKWMCHHKLD